MLRALHEQAKVLLAAFLAAACPLVAGDPLIGGAIGPGAGRDDAAAVRDYLLALQ